MRKIILIGLLFFLLIGIFFICTRSISKNAGVFLDSFISANPTKAETEYQEIDLGWNEKKSDKRIIPREEDRLNNLRGEILALSLENISEEALVPTVWIEWKDLLRGQLGTEECRYEFTLQPRERWHYSGNFPDKAANYEYWITAEEVEDIPKEIKVEYTETDWAKEKIRIIEYKTEKKKTKIGLPKWKILPYWDVIIKYQNIATENIDYMLCMQVEDKTGNIVWQKKEIKGFQEFKSGTIDSTELSNWKKLPFETYEVKFWFEPMKL